MRVINVLLKICEENFLFNIMHAKYLDILCYFIIVFLVSLCALIKNDKLFDKIKNNFLKKILLIILFGLFTSFLVFMFFLFLDSKTFQGCACKYYQDVYAKTEHNVESVSKIIKGSKVLVVGDSRMSFIQDDLQIRKPNILEFVAKSGMKIDWFEDEAMPRVYDFLNNTDYNYYVVVNMGVNDLNDNKYKGDDIALDYYNLYSELAISYPNINFYVLSVNPIDEKKINEKWSTNNRTIAEIKLFNKTIREKIDEDGISNINYCDSYNALNFSTYDGLHYTRDTNREIINYIINDCVKYE